MKILLNIASRDLTGLLICTSRNNFKLQNERIGINTQSTQQFPSDPLYPKTRLPQNRGNLLKKTPMCHAFTV